MVHRVSQAAVWLALLLTANTLTVAADGDLVGTVRVAGRPQRDVVVWLVDVPVSGPAPKPVVLDQRNLTFVPHVLAVRVGTSVQMPNSDRVYHNVFSFRDGKRFDLGLYPVGTSRVVTFDREGVSRLFCNIHPNMAGYVVAVDSSHFAVSDDGGRFRIASVAPGSYTYRAWRPGHDPMSGQLTVAADRPVEIALP